MEQHIAEVIKEYSKNRVVQDYLEFQKRPSVWSALFPERESYEKFYSRMIRYFLSPTENHGLGEAFADILVERFSESACKLNTENEELEIFTGAETEALGSNIDILYRSAQRNRLIVIEAKMNSADHSHIEKGKNGEEKIVSQLDKYFNAVVNKSGGYQDNYFIYLTIEGDEPTQEVESKDSWVCMSYKKLHEDLDKLQKIADERLAGQQNLSAVLSLISDFQQDISRKIRQHAKGMDAAASSVLSEPEVKDKFKEWSERGLFIRGVPQPKTATPAPPKTPAGTPPTVA
ncbi:PD-(D/E)XK nuclease family protein [Rothia nasimurium]|uniref:PD-(D/E)XK nuclease family protein n=1 Tax=Rothia nasimurium TaxID=85336 RepID=UPI001F1F5D88|nr:PD-(D/E)XK nuclease family protein [Rothia nasimurium]